MNTDAAAVAAALLAELGKLAAANAAPKEKKKPEPPVCSSVFEWVAEYLSSVYWRSTTTPSQQREHYWCASWFEHPEALDRLLQLWKLWESSRTSEEATLRWWKEADHHMGKLMSKTGPFSLCVKGHVEAARLSVAPTPAKFLSPGDADVKPDAIE